MTGLECNQCPANPRKAKVKDKKKPKSNYERTLDNRMDTRDEQNRPVPSWTYWPSWR